MKKILEYQSAYDPWDQPGMRELNTIYNRFRKLGIELEYGFNFPFVYLRKVNKKQVKEKFGSDHGFLLGYLPMTNHHRFRVSDTKQFIKIVRKYAGK